LDYKYHVIIAGAGVAGLYAALSLDKNVKALVLSKKALEVCNSALAQGGIAAVYNPPDDDTAKLHYHDSLRAGGFKNNPETLWRLVTEARNDIGRIISYGVDFDKDSEGEYHRTLEGGHCRRRIFHYKDSSGDEVTKKLREKVLSEPNIDVLSKAQLCGLKCTHTGFSADILIGNDHHTFDCAYFIMATGGIGRVYERTTNSAIATGDGICIAYELGAKIKNISLIQFHPTAFFDRGTVAAEGTEVTEGTAERAGGTAEETAEGTAGETAGGMTATPELDTMRECFLISESVRGEGAYLVNRDGRRFMADYDPERMELAPRDVVSHAIISESKKLDSDEFYLDITHKPAAFLREHFPAINAFLLSRGIDMTKDKIPVFPCHHYLMGGINVDVTGQTSVDRLYACGECAHTGVHGNNRLASNSLLEALVFGRTCAEEISKRLEKKPVDVKTLATYRFLRRLDAKPVPTGVRTRIRNIMQKAYFVIPDMREVKTYLPEVTHIKEELENGNFIVDADYAEAKSLATAAYLILREII
jgi:L-aspartate oxidase